MCVFLFFEMFSKSLLSVIIAEATLLYIKSKLSKKIRLSLSQEAEANQSIPGCFTKFIYFFIFF